MKNRLTAIALLISLLGILVLAPFGAMAAPAPSASANVAPITTAAVGVPITGTFTDALGGTGTFAGTFNITRFVARNGQLAAVGTLTGTLTDSLGNILGTVTQQITTPLASIQATCQILHLVLGPLDLNLLGLNVHLNQVVLDITAQSGPGNLLGNLLCAVAHLLDGNAALTAIANLLNQILHLIG